MRLPFACVSRASAIHGVEAAEPLPYSGDLEEEEEEEEAVRALSNPDFSIISYVPPVQPNF